MGNKYRSKNHSRQSTFGMIDAIIGALVVLALLSSFNIIPTGFANFIMQLLISAIPGIILSIIAGQLVESFTGDSLKKISLTFDFHEIPISITFFALTTLLIKIIFLN